MDLGQRSASLLAGEQAEKSEWTLTSRMGKISSKFPQNAFTFPFWGSLRQEFPGINVSGFLPRRTSGCCSWRTGNK